MKGSWHSTVRRSLVSSAGALLLGITGVAEAGHDKPRITVQIDSPHISTRFSSSPYWGGGYHDRHDHDWRNCPPPHPRGYYVPGHWEWQPPQYYGRGDHRHDRRYDRRHDDRAWHHDRGKHRGWEKQRARSDHRWDDDRGWDDDRRKHR